MRIVAVIAKLYLEAVMSAMGRERTSEDVMVTILEKLVGWAIAVALITTVGGWWGIAILVGLGFVVYLAVGRRSPAE